MNEFEEVIQKLNKKSEEYNPSLLQQQRVKNLIFSKDFSKKESKTGIFNMLFLQVMKIFKSKPFWAVSGMAALLIFFGTPLLFMGNTKFENSMVPMQDRMEEPMGSPMYDMEVSNGSLNENSADSVVLDESEKKRIEAYIMDNSHNIASIDSIDEDTETPQYDRAQRRDADISITVEDFNQKYVELNNKISAIGGYVLNSNTNVSEYRSSANVTARVPVDQFDSFMNYLRSLGVKVNSENISITDKQNELTQVAKQIQEIQEKIDELNAKDELNNEEEMDLKKYKNQLENNKKNEEGIRQETEFSTVQITLETEYKYSDDDGSSESTWDEVAQSIEWIFEFWLDAAMWSVVPLLFCSPILIIVGGIVWYVKKKKNNKNN